MAKNLSQPANEPLPSFDSKEFLITLTTQPGIYQMLDAKGGILYIGKARNLKNRVSSYFRGTLTDAKTTALVKQINQIRIIVTNSENEALLLESNLIKKFQPRYNVLLRDDKSYPYLFLTAHKDYPRLEACRGRKIKEGRYFGPYLNAAMVYETLQLLQRLFKLRQCQDGFFRNRTRPCLQYQIKRCSAPCVGLIKSADYQEDVRNSVLFLEGKNQEVIKTLIQRMDKAAESLQFEHAAQYRDQIGRLRVIQEQQHVALAGGTQDADVLAVIAEADIICIQMLAIRGGQLLASKSYFPQVPRDTTLSEALAAFIAQYYFAIESDKPIPKKILLNLGLEDQDWLQAVLRERAGRAVSLAHAKRGVGAHWIAIAIKNAKQTLVSHIAGKNQQLAKMQTLQEALQLSELPERLECFDISHTQGEATVASCVVFDQKGALSSAYRRFNIRSIEPGDDYAAMRQALTRHYTRLKMAAEKMPDIVFIDGGKGQLRQAMEVFEELQITQVLLVGVAKGVTRKPGLETLWLAGLEKPLDIAAENPALHLIQQIRDEAHRFAITGHRRKRDKKRLASSLQDIAGIGAKRRRALLKHFGGLQEVKRASAAEIAKVTGISQGLAVKIYTALHGA